MGAAARQPPFGCAPGTTYLPQHPILEPNIDIGISLSFDSNVSTTPARTQHGGSTFISAPCITAPFITASYSPEFAVRVIKNIKFLLYNQRTIQISQTSNCVRRLKDERTNRASSLMMKPATASLQLIHSLFGHLTAGYI